jgi:hypothetical protein
MEILRLGLRPVQVVRVVVEMQELLALRLVSAALQTRAAAVAAGMISLRDCQEGQGVLVL